MCRRPKLTCGFAYNNHDSSVCFAIESKIELVLEAERVFRRKKLKCSKGNIEKLIKFGLANLGRSVEDVDCWCATSLGNPSLNASDIFQPDGVSVREPYWIDMNLFGAKKKVLLVNHHLAHAASYFSSDFDDAVVVTCDGGGDFSTKTKKSDCNAVYLAKETQLKRVLMDLGTLMSAKFYGVCAAYVFGREPFNEGKLMALAALGQPEVEMVRKLEASLYELSYEDRVEGFKILEGHFPGARDAAVSQCSDAYNFAASVQKVFTTRRVQDLEFVLDRLRPDTNNMVLAGGACLNLDANSDVFERFSQYNQFIAPCCDDTGQALGAVSIAIVRTQGVRPKIDLPYIGMGESDYSFDSTTINAAVETLMQNGVVVVHNGKAEVGPRALGNRSIIARPDSSEVKREVSVGIKQREVYRPVAPVVLEKKFHEYFWGPFPSPFMLHKHYVKDEFREILEGAVHVDGTARAQTLQREDNPFLYELIEAFGDQTGLYLLLNTSCNCKGEPISNDVLSSLSLLERTKNKSMLIFNGKQV